MDIKKLYELIDQEIDAAYENPTSLRAHPFMMPPQMSVGSEQQAVEHLEEIKDLMGYIGDALENWSRDHEVPPTMKVDVAVSVTNESTDQNPMIEEGKEHFPQESQVTSSKEEETDLLREIQNVVDKWKGKDGEAKVEEVELEISTENGELDKLKVEADVEEDTDEVLGEAMEATQDVEAPSEEEQQENALEEASEEPLEEVVEEQDSVEDEEDSQQITYMEKTTENFDLCPQAVEAFDTLIDNEDEAVLELMSSVDDFLSMFREMDSGISHEDYEELLKKNFEISTFVGKISNDLDLDLLDDFYFLVDKMEEAAQNIKS